MKFGHVEAEEIDNIDFTLSPDHPLSTFSGRPAGTRFYVGCGKWGIPKWVGPLYPKGTKQKDYLMQYINHFNSIELNGTFYRLSRSSVEKWAEAAEGKDFLFCPKWSQRISHFKRFKEIEENTQYFIDAMELLGDNLGCTFITLPPNFAPKYRERILDFIKLLPQNYPIQLEFRHQEWFEKDIFNEVATAVKEKGLGIAITDVATRRDVLHMCLTNPIAFVRFNGYGLHQSDYQRLDDWIDRLEEWTKKGIDKVFFFMHQQDEANTIVLCEYFIDKINERLNAEVKPLSLNS